MPTKTWIATTAANWNTAGSWSPSGIPATGDDVIFNGSANGNCTLATTAGACRSLVMTGYTGTFANSIGLTISGSDDGTVNGNTLVLAASPAVYSGTSTITLTSTYGGKITCNGNSLNSSLTINGVGGTFTLTDTLTLNSARTLVLTAGTITGTSASVGLCSVSSNANVKNITLTNLTVSGAGNVLNINAGLTNYTQSITNLNVTGTVAGTKYLVMQGISGIVNIYFSCTGSGADTIGFSSTDGLCTNLYFTGTNSGCQILSRGVAVSGDLDFGTSSVTWVSAASGYTWSVTGNVTFSPNMVITATNMTISLNGTGSQNVTMNTETFSSPFIINKASGTATFLDAASFSSTFTNTLGTTVFNNTLNSTGNITVTAGSFTFNNNATTTGTLTLTAGTLTALKNVTCGIFSSNNSNTRTLNMGPGTWTLTSTGTIWNITSSVGMTLNAQTSRILINNTASPAATITFAGGGLTYYIVEHSRGSATAACSFSGSNTYVNFIDNASTAAHSLLFGSGTTQNFYKFNVRGSAGALVTISRTSTTLVTLVKVGQGIVPYCDYITIGTVTASPANTWYVGANGSIGTGTGWVAGNAPSSQSLLGIGGSG